MYGEYQRYLEELKTQLTTLEGKVSAVDNARKDSVSRTELDEKVKQAQEQLNEFKARLNWKFAKQSLFRQATTEGNKRREERLKELEGKVAGVEGRELAANILRQQLEEKDRQRAEMEQNILKMQDLLQAQIDTILSARESEAQERGEEEEQTASLDARVKELSEAMAQMKSDDAEQEAAATAIKKEMEGYKDTLEQMEAYLKSIDRGPTKDDAPYVPYDDYDDGSGNDTSDAGSSPRSPFQRMRAAIMNEVSELQLEVQNIIVKQDEVQDEELAVELKEEMIRLMNEKMLALQKQLQKLRVDAGQSIARRADDIKAGDDAVLKKLEGDIEELKKELGIQTETFEENPGEKPAYSAML